MTNLYVRNRVCALDSQRFFRHIVFFRLYSSLDFEENKISFIGLFKLNNTLTVNRIRTYIYMFVHYILTLSLAPISVLILPMFRQKLWPQ